MSNITTQDYFAPLMLYITAGIIIAINTIIIFNCSFIVCVIAIIITLIVMNPILDFVERKCK